MAKKFPAWAKPAGWGAVVGAVAISFVGLGADWVVTEKVALRMAAQESNKAVVGALVPICVAQFRSLPKAEWPGHLDALEKVSTWDRGTYIRKQGWATMPGAKEAATDAVATACATELLAVAAKPA